MPCKRSDDDQRLLEKNAACAGSFFSVPVLFMASKSGEYRDRALLTARAIAIIFTELELVKVSLLQRLDADEEGFFVKPDDLTDEGLKVASAVLHRWLQNTDRWKNVGVPPLSKYTDSLRRQISKHLK